MVCMAHGDVNQPESDEFWVTKINVGIFFHVQTEKCNHETLGLHWLEYRFPGATWCNNCF